MFVLRQFKEKVLLCKSQRIQADTANMRGRRRALFGGGKEVWHTGSPILFTTKAFSAFSSDQHK
jgi:hypothetical protein